MGLVADPNELRRDACLSPCTPHAALEHMRDADLLPYLCDSLGRGTIVHRGCARDDADSLRTEPGNMCAQLLSQAVAEVVVPLLPLSQVLKWQHEQPDLTLVGLGRTVVVFQGTRETVAPLRKRL